MVFVKAFVLACVLSLFACGGCDDSAGGKNNANNGANNGGSNNGTGSNNGGTNGGSNNSVFERNEAGQVLCKDDEPCACDNGIDDDGDGLIDGLDPECTGPYDDDEGTFATGIPGDNKDPKWQDCFFDGNSGAGDDGCRYHTDCLTGDLDPTDEDCSVVARCLDFCRPRTPNGCDCFGCCEIFADDGTSSFVQIGNDCSTDDISACQTCQQSTECVNECGTCELCLGREVGDLPAECSGGGTGNNGMGDAGTSDGGGTGDGGGSGGPGYTCDDGEVVCETTSDCPNNHYCQLGCCIAIILESGQRSRLKFTTLNPSAG